MRVDMLLVIAWIGGFVVYISKVEVINYRNYRQFTIALKQFVTVIGENNIGKSNLLEAMALVLSHDISVYRKRKLDVDDFNFQTIDEFKRRVIDGEKDIVFPEVRVNLYFSDLDEEQEAVMDDCWYDFSNKIARLSYVYSCRQCKKIEILNNYKTIIEQKKAEGQDDDSIKKYLDFPIDEYEYSIVCGHDDKTMDNYWLKLIKMEYLYALRDAQTELNSNNSNKLLYRILRDRDTEDYSAIKKKMIELDNIIKRDAEALNALKQDIGRYLEKLSLETETSTNKINFEFSSLELSEILKKIGIQYGDVAVSIERNGLGRNNLLYMAVVLAHLYERQSNYFRLIAIEEPEAHLCPTLQKHLAKNIFDEAENSRQQIIITTHSTHIASYLDLDSTVVLFKDHNEVKNHYLLDGFGKSKDDEKSIGYLKKWLNSTNSTMFYSRKIIFVEGIAEQMLIPIFYEWQYGKTLEKANCQVVNVNGVAFKHFLKVVKNGYFLRTVVLTDSDDGLKTENRALDLKSEYDSEVINVYITNKTTFEKDILHTNASQKKNREFLVDVVKAIRPQKCDASFCEEQKKALDVEKMFECIVDYKSDFAFELSDSLLKEMKNKTRQNKFQVPKYINEAFKFIEGDAE
jgi:predicted ATP-dependent endonuclease of OLD family